MDDGLDRALIEGLRESVTVSRPVRDAAGRIVDWAFLSANRAALEVLGRPLDQIAGHSLSEVLGPDLVAREAAAYERVLLSGEPWNHESNFGGRCLLVSVLRVGDDAVASVAMDITERNQAEEKLREVDRQRSEFLALLSHELRNPLTPMRNGLQVLRLAPPNSPVAARAIDSLERQVDNLARMVDDLLDSTRLARNKLRLQLRPTDLRELLSQAADDHHGVFERRGIVLEVSCPREPIPVHVDPARICQLIGNLLHNAAKFTPRGGRTELSASVERDTGTTTIRVVDTGAGIDPEMMAQLFLPFAQARSTIENSRGGLGLGLSLVKSLAELHGGSVSASSRGPGQGASFAVCLPLAEERRFAGTRPSSQPGPRRRRVLIIEDDPDAADSLSDVLELLGHEVMIARDGAGGVEAALLFRPEVVLCDLGLPGMDGYSVARALRQAPELGATIKLVALSGHARPEDVMKARAAGFDLHIAKPPDPAAIELALAG